MFSSVPFPEMLACMHTHACVNVCVRVFIMYVLYELNLENMYI